MVVKESDDRFCIKASMIPGAGNGLFALAPLAEGDRLEVIGVLVEAGSVADRCTRFADCYKFRVGELLLIPIGYGGMVNHSTRPNVEKIVDGQRVYLQAMRSIEVGEELQFTYGERFFQVAKLDPGAFSAQ